LSTLPTTATTTTTTNLLNNNNKQLKHLNTENTFEIVITDSLINNVKATRPTNFEEHLSSNLSTSSSSSSSSSQANDYSPVKETNFVNQTKMKYTNQDLELLKPTKAVHLSARNNSDLNSITTNTTNENNQKLNLQQRIQQKRHSLSIK